MHNISTARPLVSDRGRGKPNIIFVCTRGRNIDFEVGGVIINQRSPETQSDTAKWQRQSCSMENLPRQIFCARRPARVGVEAS